VFGAVCNLLCWGLTDYQHFYLQHERLIWSPTLIIVESLLLAPLLALFIFRRSARVVFLYVVALILILKMQIDQLGVVQKIDGPALLLTLLGGISIIVVLLCAAFRCVVIIRDAPKSDEPTS
jgi:hypothetical protein